MKNHKSNLFIYSTAQVIKYRFDWSKQIYSLNSLNATQSNFSGTKLSFRLYLLEMIQTTNGYREINFIIAFQKRCSEKKVELI